MGRGNPYYYRHRGSEEMYAVGGGVIARNVEFALKKIGRENPGGKMFAIVDCNNFYCSCERVFKPALAKRPVIVLSNNDGCAISRSEEAKSLGIAMAAPAFMMRDLIEKHDVA